MGGCGAGVHFYFTSGETEAHASCRDSHRCPGGPAGTRGAPAIPAARGRAHLPRTWAAAAAAGRSPSGCGPRGPQEGLRRGQQLPAAAGLEGHVASAGRGGIPGPSARLLARRAYTPGPRRTGKIRSGAEGAAAPRPPAPGGALGAAWPPAGALRVGSDPKLRAPSRSLWTREGGRRVSLGRRGPTAARSALPR